MTAMSPKIRGSKPDRIPTTKHIRASGSLETPLAARIAILGKR